MHPVRSIIYEIGVAQWPWEWHHWFFFLYTLLYKYNETPLILIFSSHIKNIFLGTLRWRATVRKESSASLSRGSDAITVRAKTNDKR